MKRLLAAPLLFLALATPAIADTVSVGTNATYDYSATTSGGTVTATVVFSMTAAGQLTVTLTNTTGLSGGGTGSSTRPALTAIAFTTTPNITPNEGSLTKSSNIADWHFGNNTGFGAGQWEVRVGDSGTCNQGAAPGTSINGAICAGETGSFSFSFTSALSSIEIDLTAVKFQTSVGSFEPTGTSTQTPEPASLMLFGTGLLSLGGYVRRRLKG